MKNLKTFEEIHESKDGSETEFQKIFKIVKDSTVAEKIEKIGHSSTKDVIFKLCYEWIKTDNITYNQFIKILSYYGLYKN